MNTRQMTLLAFLLSNSQYEKVDNIADHFAVSSKTIRRDIEIIRKSITDIGGDIDLKPGSGVRIVATQTTRKTIEDLFISVIGKYSKGTYPDRKERLLLVAIAIFMARQPTPIDWITNYFYISRSQLNLDLRDIWKNLNPKGVSFSVEEKKIQITGSERDIRNVLNTILFQYIENNYDISKIVFPEFKNHEIRTIPFLSQDEINTLNQLIIALTEYATTTLWKTDTTIILISLLVFIKRKLNNFPSAEEVFEDCKEQLDLRSFIEIIELELYARYGIRLDGQEKRYICDILQSTQLIHNLRKSMEEGRSLEESSLIDNFSEDFIDAFSTITDINLRKKPNFITRIKDHIRPMIKRVQIGLGIVDEHLEDYAQEYRSTLNVCEIICWILTKKYALPFIPRAEVLFLMLYIQIEIIESEACLRIAFISQEEKSLTNIQLARLKKEFPNWTFVFLPEITKQDFYSQEFDCVITSDIKLNDIEFPWINVSRKISALDIKLIKTFVYETTIQKTKNIHKLKEILRDLRDLGCHVNIQTNPEFSTEETREGLFVEGVNKVKFMYYEAGNQVNRVLVENLQEEENQVRITIDMNNWDLSLFASKIVYLVDKIHTKELNTILNQIEPEFREEENV